MVGICLGEGKMIGTMQCSAEGTQAMPRELVGNTLRPCLIHIPPAALFPPVCEFCQRHHCSGALSPTTERCTVHLSPQAFQVGTAVKPRNAFQVAVHQLQLLQHWEPLQHLQAEGWGGTCAQGLRGRTSPVGDRKYSRKCTLNRPLANSSFVKPFASQRSRKSGATGCCPDPQFLKGW